jgi:hypothetical protein
MLIKKSKKQNYRGVFTKSPAISGNKNEISPSKRRSGANVSSFAAHEAK